jgi:hypothetical protein
MDYFYNYKVRGRRGNVKEVCNRNVVVAFISRSKTPFENTVNPGGV